MTMFCPLAAASVAVDLIDCSTADAEEFDAVHADRREAHELHWLAHGEGPWQPIVSDEP